MDRVYARLATLLSIAALAIGLSAGVAGQEGGARLPPELSEVLVHSPLGTCSASDSQAGRAPTRLRVATWNIRAARSAPLDGVAAEIAAMQVDIIAAQEVDLRTRRSGLVDQPEAIAAALGFQYVFAASIKWEEGDYGLAVFSRWPLTEVRRHRLDATTATEPRIVLEATVCARGRTLHVFNHHADGWVGSRETGFAELKRIVQGEIGRGFLVMGDFNEQPDGPGVGGLVAAGLVDLGNELGIRVENRRRIDYLLADPLLAGRSSLARVWPTDKSDHHAMLADLEW